MTAIPGPGKLPGEVSGKLPEWRRVLAVVAHPDDESFGLGAVIDAFVQVGTVVEVLCLTQGEASTLAAAADLGPRRSAELAEAGRRLGVAQVRLHDFADGALDLVDPQEVDDVVAATMRAVLPDGLLVFDPSGVTGHPDHRAATASAVRVAQRQELPVRAWTLPSGGVDALNTEFGSTLHGNAAEEIDVQLEVSRGTQRHAVAAHESQAVPGSILWRRLELLGDREVLRWLPTTPP